MIHKRTVSIISDPSNKTKQRWNAAHYTQIKVSVDPETATAFKNACAAADVSMASVLSKFMADYTQQSLKEKPPSDPFATRRQRRNTIKTIISQMEKVALAEECYRDNIPENLQGSKRYDDADQSLAAMHEVIELMSEIY